MAIECKVFDINDNYLLSFNYKEELNKVIEVLSNNTPDTHKFTNNDLNIFIGLTDISGIKEESLFIQNKHNVDDIVVFGLAIIDDCKGNYDIEITNHLISFFREDYDNDTILGVDVDNNLNWFVDEFCFEDETNIEYLKEYLYEAKNYTEYKNQYDSLREVEIYNSTYKNN